MTPSPKQKERELIERLAEAMVKAWWPSLKWDDHGDEDKEDYRILARAAIKAMRKK